MKKRLALALCAALLLLYAIVPACADQAVETARPSVNGRLHVEGAQLTDAAGRPVQLRGVSTHGLIWFPNRPSRSRCTGISAR